MKASEPLIRHQLAEFQLLVSADGGALTLSGVEETTVHVDYMRPKGDELCATCVLSDEDLAEMLRERIAVLVPSITRVEIHPQPET